MLVAAPCTLKSKTLCLQANAGVQDLKDTLTNPGQSAANVSKQVHHPPRSALCASLATPSWEHDTDVCSSQAIDAAEPKTTESMPIVVWNCEILQQDLAADFGIHTRRRRPAAPSRRPTGC